MDEAVKQNVAMFERAMRMFSPFGPTAGRPAQPEAAPGADPADPIAEMRRQMDVMRAQIERLAGGPPKS